MVRKNKNCRKTLLPSSSAAGFIGALLVLIQKLCNPHVAVGWSSLMCAMLVLFGITFLMLGIIGEYIGKLILNINKTPQFVVRDIINADYDPEGKEKDHEKMV